jgi:DNA-3-methyladenine glycosylase I
VTTALTDAARPRCAWAADAPVVYRDYHDHEWGRPLRGAVALFERMSLEAFQSGLSWLTILRKRENFRRAFTGFDIEAVAGFGERDVTRLMADPGIVRNRLKVAAAITNAQAYLRLRAEGQTLDGFLWAYVDGQPIVNSWQAGEFPAKTPLSDQLSKDLLKRGFKFVGSTIIYAYMQGIGMVNDHAPECFCRAG